MKFKKIILLMLVFSLVGAASAWADDLYDYYKAKKIKIIVNQNEYDALSGLSVLGTNRTMKMVALQDIGDTLQALVKTEDGSIININKPNVHMSLFEAVKGDTKLSPFGDVNQGGKYNFVIFSQIDNLLMDISSLKITIDDPYKMEVKKITEEVNEPGDHFWYSTEQISLEFKYSGKYTVNFYMKPSGGEYTLVSQKTIYSIKKNSNSKPAYMFDD